MEELSRSDILYFCFRIRRKYREATHRLRLSVMLATVREASLFGWGRHLSVLKNRALLFINPTKELV